MMQKQAKIGVFWLLFALGLGACGEDGTDPPPPPENHAPTAKAGADQSIKLGAKVTLDASDSKDDDGDPLTFKWQLKAQPAGSSLEIKDTTKSASFTPTKAGEYQVQLTVSDGTLSATDDVKITVSEEQQNGKPVANIVGSERVLTTTEVTLDGSKSSDPDKDTLTYKWTLKTKPEGSTAALADADKDKAKFTADKAGDYTVALVVNDGKQDSDVLEFKVSAVAENKKPIAQVAATARALKETELTLDGSKSSDPDNDSLSYAWTVKTSPEGSHATLTEQDKVAAKFKADKAGTYTLELVVSDGIASSDAAAITVTVKDANADPVAKAVATASGKINTDVALDGSASSDADEGDPLTFKWSIKTKVDGSTAALSDAAIAKPNFKADKAGEYTLELIVSDGIKESAAASVKVTLTE